MSGPGLQFRKLDLHVHTPASSDFRDKSVTADQIVKRAIKAGLDAIAITDHNTGEWIDRVKNAAKGKDLVVFPGVEISCEGGERGLHVIALLDVDKNSAHVSDLLSRLDIPPDRRGNTDALAKGTLAHVISIIQSDEKEGIAVPAHVNSSKGILADMKGEQRKTLINSGKLLAVEARCFKNENLRAKDRRAIDIFDGNHPDYPKRIAVYQASDNPAGPSQKGHGLWGIGRCCAHFKMEEINLESLRQCFLDPEVRIRQDFEFERFAYPRLASISIENGFFQGEKADFNEGLNSILGGKGTGKSLLVELLRFALNKPSEIPSLCTEQKNKLKHRLGDFGKVTVHYIDETGKEFKITRSLDPNTSGYDEIGFDPSIVCDTLFLSQNEILKVAEDESLQLDFIDRFFSAHRYEDRIDDLKHQIQDLDKNLGAGIRAEQEISYLEESIATTQLEIEKLDTKLDNPIFRDYSMADETRLALLSQASFLDEVEKSTSGYRDKVNSLEIPVLPDSLANITTLIENRKRLEATKEFVETQIRALWEKFSEDREFFAVGQRPFDRQYNETRQKYLQFVRDEGGDRPQLAGEREQLSKRLQELEQRHRTEQRKAINVGDLTKSRDQLLDEMEAIYEEWRSARNERCEHIESNSNGRLQLGIIASSSTDAFCERLIELKRGSNLRDSDIQKLAESNHPRAFVQSLLEYRIRQNSSAQDKSAPLTTLADNAQLPLERVSRLATYLLANTEIEKLLELQYRAYPKDRPQIKYRVTDDTYKLLDAVSVGQKCTALLIMTLTDGQMPIVIDQPEDSLDIRTIWEDICSKIRHHKNRRQFIFTTHNSSVAVASDTDNFIILESGSEKGRIVFSGSMDSNEIGEEVLKYLEGGTVPYRRKHQKYRAEKRLRIH